jgi:hypothetical protein
MTGPIVQRRNVFGRLYHGETSIDFIGRTRLWFTISLVAIAIVSLVSLVLPAYNPVRAVETLMELNDPHVLQVQDGIAAIDAGTDP